GRRTGRPAPPRLEDTRRGRKSEATLEASSHLGLSLPEAGPPESGRGGEQFPLPILDLEAPPMPETVVHFQIRMPPALHEQLASWAKEDKASLNALIVGLLEKAVEQHDKSGS